MSLHESSCAVYKKGTAIRHFGEIEATPHSARTTTMSKHNDTPRDARMDLRLTAEEKALIERAATACGDDISSLVRRASVIEAKRILNAVEGKSRP